MKTKIVFVTSLCLVVLFGSYAIYKEHFSNEVLVRFDVTDVEMIPTPTAEEEIQPQQVTAQAPKTVKRLGVTADLKKQVPKLGFKQIVPEPTFEGLGMLGNVTRNGVSGFDGTILRVLRLKPVTDAVEHRYNLPAGLILAMAAQEANGAALLTNGADDGGAGDCHMQPLIAHQWGLRVYKDCRVMVDKVHGCALRSLIKQQRSDMRKLIQFDDRFHSIINLDAVGRMISVYMQMDAPKHRAYTGVNALQAAVFRYSGRSEYWDKVVKWRKLLQDRGIIDEVRQRFNVVNQDLVVDGEKGNFDLYLQASWKRWVNFGLNEYKKMPLYSPKGAEKILARYGPIPKQ